MRLPNLRGINKDVFIEWLIGNKVAAQYVKKLTKKLIEMSERNFREKDKTLNVNAIVRFQNLKIKCTLKL
jgi:hypothetical protein